MKKELMNYVKKVDITIRALRSIDIIDMESKEAEKIKGSLGIGEAVCKDLRKVIERGNEELELLIYFWDMEKGLNAMEEMAKLYENDEELEGMIGATKAFCKDIERILEGF